MALLRTRALLGTLLSLLIACEAFDPVETVDLCQRGQGVISSRCAQCQAPPFSPRCPQCQPDAGVDRGCKNAALAAQDGAAQADGGVDASDATEAGAADGGGAGSGTRDAAAGNDVDGSASADAGPCGTPCTGKKDLCDADHGLCVECLSNANCAGNATRKRCGASGECVQCESHADCPASAPACSEAAHTCGACEDNAPCQGRPERTVCDTEPTATEGACVECTGNDFDCGKAADLTPYVCDSEARTCTTTKQGAALACKPCVSDAQCASGHVCMPMVFGASDTPAGKFCLWRQDAVTAADCTHVRPHVGTEAGWTSVDGKSVTVCKPARTTCQALEAFANSSCAGDSSTGHLQCRHFGLTDAYCAPFNAGHRCTVPCVSYDDCDDTRGGDDECQNLSLDGATPKVCLFQ